MLRNITFFHAYLVTICTVFCAFHVDYNEMRPETITLEELVNLGREIMRRLTGKYTDDDRHCLPRDVFQYYNYLDNVQQMIIGENPNGSVIYEALRDSGGPPHLNYSVNYDWLKNERNFSDYELNEMKDCIKETKHLWIIVTSVYKGERLKKYPGNDTTIEQSLYDSFDNLDDIFERYENDTEGLR